MKKLLTLAAATAFMVTTASAATLTEDHKKVKSAHDETGLMFQKLVTQSMSMKDGEKPNESYTHQCSEYAEKLADATTCKNLAIKEEKLLLKIVQDLKSKAPQIEITLQDGIAKLEALKVAAPVAPADK